jgi:hypothetical protein
MSLLPRHTQMYCQHLTAVAHGDDDEFFGDGSDQSLASVTWPLDGSAAAGIDVWLHMGRLALRCVVPMELSAAMLRYAFACFGEDSCRRKHRQLLRALCLVSPLPHVFLVPHLGATTAGSAMCWQHENQQWKRVRQRMLLQTALRSAACLCCC